MKPRNTLTPEQLEKLYAVLQSLELDGCKFAKKELVLLYGLFVSMPFALRSNEAAIHTRMHIIETQLQALHRFEVHKTIAASSSLQGRVRAMSETVGRLAQNVKDGGGICL